MSGKPGMRRTSAVNAIRRQIWRSMRILRRFTQPDLLRTVPNATMNNVKKYVHMLTCHGYLCKDGTMISGRLGEFQMYRLVRNNGPIHPTRCDVCGESITIKTCVVPEKKETKKETETEPEVAYDAA